MMTSAGTPGAVDVRTPLGSLVHATVPPNFALPLSDGEPVVIQAGNGPLLGYVLVRPLLVIDRHSLNDASPRLLRRATSQDLALRRRHEARERDALRVATMKIRERGLGMKLARAEQLFDGSRLVFYFTAEERVDFRELVRELATDFKMRIELRQIGVRDEAKMLTGYGTCGRPLCCTSWLKAFDPVSIKMAKQQDLALNPARLSGLCGRLKCCLRYELPNGAHSARPSNGSYPGASGEPGPPAGGGCSRSGAGGGCGCRRR
ncbi:MAG: regulatory iron-sulfur-containing complex subunit RicT [Acidobacteriota bacterium]